MSPELCKTVTERCHLAVHGSRRRVEVEHEQLAPHGVGASLNTFERWFALGSVTSACSGGDESGARVLGSTVTSAAGLSLRFLEIKEDALEVVAV